MSIWKNNDFWAWTLGFAAVDTILLVLWKIQFGKDSEGIIVLAFGMAIVLAMQLIAGLILHLARKERVWGRAMLMASVIMLLVGFGICTAHF